MKDAEEFVGFFSALYGGHGSHFPQAHLPIYEEKKVLMFQTKHMLPSSLGAGFNTRSKSR